VNTITCHLGRKPHEEFEDIEDDEPHVVDKNVVVAKNVDVVAQMIVKNVKRTTTNEDRKPPENNEKSKPKKTSKTRKKKELAAVASKLKLKKINTFLQPIKRGTTMYNEQSALHENAFSPSNRPSILPTKNGRNTAGSNSQNCISQPGESK
jgi:hypothetical protein